MRERWSTRGRQGAVVVLAALAVHVAPVLAANPVFVDAAGVCAGNTPCFTTIQDGVNNADPGAIVFVLPGTYPESVNFSLMGSAISGSPGDITLAVGHSLADVLAFLAPDQVIMQPASGPAFFNSVTPFPGDIEIIGGFTVVSKDSDGVRLHTTGDVSVAGVNSSGNALGGIILTSDNGSAMAVLARADDNKGGDGIDLNALGDNDVAVFNSTANHNAAIGINASASDGNVQVLGFILLPGFPETTTADNNTINGMNLTAGGGDVTVGLLFLAQPGTLPPSVTSKLPAMNIPRAPIQHGVDRFRGLSALFTTASPTMFGPVTANGNGGDGISAAATGTVNGIGVATDSNGNIGFFINATDSVSLVAASADNNTARSGFDISSMNDVTMLLITALGNGRDGVTIETADSLVIEASYISGNTRDGVKVSALSPPNCDAGSLACLGSSDAVNSSIICNNGTAGLDVPPTVAFDAEGNWWGAFNGPAPSGSGNAVVGTTDFTPFIDTVTVTGPALPATVGFLSPFDFQFSGGNGTVFLGSIFFAPQDTLGPGDPLGVPPFTLTTDNGVLISNGPVFISTPFFTQTGTTVGGFITKPSAVLQVQALPGRAGQVTVSLLGPCGLTGSATVDVKPVPAPVLSDGALGMLAALLAVAGFWVARRRPMVGAQT